MMTLARRSPLLLLCLALAPHAGVPNTFASGTTIKAAEMNENFASLSNRLDSLAAALRSKDSSLAALKAKTKTDSTALATYTLQSMPKGAVIGLLTAPGSDGYLTGSNATWLLAAGQGTVNGVSVPDLRGSFLRGIDYTLTGYAANGKDPDGTRKVGAFQTDMLGSHDHNISNWGLIGKSTTGGVWDTYNDGATNLLQATDGRVATSGRVAESFPQSMPTAGGAETRPKNIAVYWYVKVK